MMRILVCGAQGQVGQALVSQGAEAGYQMIACDRDRLDITSAVALDGVIAAEQPELIINAAAYTAVDKAESDKDVAFVINDAAAGNLARACQQQGIPLFHISTDYVFDGSKFGAWSETDEVAPLGVYGQSKEAGERAVREVLEQHIILRTSWVFSSGGTNFLTTMLRLGAERDELSIVADQQGCPTSAASIAVCLLALVERNRQGDLRWGTYHFSNEPACSWYDFASHIFSRGSALGLLSKAPLLHAITTSEYPTPARRPANSVLACDKIRAVGVAIPDWRDELETALQAFAEIRSVDE